MKALKKFYYFFLSLVIFLPLFSGCAAVPVSDEELNSLGAEVKSNMIAQYGEYDDGKVVSYVDSVGKKVEASSDYFGKPLTFTVLDTPVVNAFSVPGGYIFVTRGLLARGNSESELAFVLGHEIGHLTARHSAQRISQMRTSNLFSSFLGLFISMYTKDSNLANIVSGVVDFSSALAILNYGRDAEFEADQLGLRYAFLAKYDPGMGTKFLKTLETMDNSKRERSALSDLLATHPPTDERIKKADLISQGYLGSSEDSSKGLEIGRNEYIKRIDGIVLGDSLNAGFVKDGKYFNKGYMFVLNSPSGWKLLTSRSYLAALYKDANNHFLVFASKYKASEKLEDNATAFLREALQDRSLAPQYSGTKFLGVNAIVFSGKKGRSLRAMFFRKGAIDHSLVLSYNADSSTDYSAMFSALCGNFVFMDEATASQIYEDKLRLYVVRSGDSLDKVSMSFYGQPKYKGELMLYNGLDVAISQGMLLKVPPTKYFDD